MVGTEVVCIANNDAVLGGLLTVYHVERSTGSLENVQNDLPVCPKPECNMCQRTWWPEPLVVVGPDLQGSRFRSCF